MREEETDLSFAEFGDSGRLYPSPTSESDRDELRNYAELLARREGFEPALDGDDDESLLARHCPERATFEAERVQSKPVGYFTPVQ